MKIKLNDHDFSISDRIEATSSNIFNFHFMTYVTDMNSKNEYYVALHDNIRLLESVADLSAVDHGIIDTKYRSKIDMIIFNRFLVDL